MPSFCRFYLESKFAYHLSENRLLDMLSQMGMKVAQSTLNGWMQQIMTYLRERLRPVITADRAVLYEAFKVFLQDGRVEMHNNAVERMFRHLAMGRRNWMHTGSHLGAENIAFMFSLFESCKLNDINFSII